MIRRLPHVAKLEHRIAALTEENRALRAEIAALKTDRDSLTRYTNSVESDLSSAYRQLTDAGAELDIVCSQRDALATERDDLQRHLARLEAENDDLLQRANTLIEERDEMRAHAERLQTELERAAERFDTVSRERDELREHASRLDARLRSIEEFTRAAPPGHFYSPLVDTTDVHVRNALDSPAPLRDLPAFQPRNLITHHVALSKHNQRLNLVLHSTPGHRFYLENDFFSYADALAYACLLLEYQPRRAIEIGCGYSSYLAMDINDRYLDGRTRFTFVDPNIAWKRLAEDDPYRANIRPVALQDFPPEEIDALEPGDILFYDGSHVMKTGSDVNVFFFEILPRVKPGVLVHIHDIFYPFEYPRHWVLEDRRNWNEIYLLRAWLQNNPQVEILIFNDYLYTRHPELAAEPLALRNTGSSFWFRKLDR